MSVEKTATESLYERIYALIKQIPSGQVATYGQLAECVGCTARQAGYALAATPSDKAIPWHRVVNAQGKLSIRASGQASTEQYQRLVSEGLVFSASKRLDLNRYRWQPVDDESDWDEPDVAGMG